MTEPHSQQPPATAPDHTVTGNHKWDDSEFRVAPRAPWWQRHRGELIGLAVLLLALAVVVFWLPQAVKNAATLPSAPAGTAPSSTPATPDANSSAAAAETGTAASGPVNSPWQDAQLAKARREAQDILTQLLDRQKSLEAMQVQLWADEAYQAAADHARQGDELYRNRDFPAALASYQTALAQLDALIEQAEQEFNQALADGQQAILDQQPQPAIDAYTLATAIRPDSDEAQTGLARAKVQEEVIALLEAAEQQLRQQQHPAAKAHLEQALALDSHSQAAKDKLAQVEQAISNDHFASVMGQAYSLLQQQQYSQAISRFRQALTLKPGDAAAQDGLAQASHLHTQTRIQQALQQAENFESQEQWQQALNQYQAAQKLDASVVAARVGILRTQARAQLDQQLQQLIEQPLRLSDGEVYRSAQRLLTDAAQVKPRGPRIEQQQQQLQQALAKALNPVPVLLRSDNKTSVTLYRVGNLGSFKQHPLELKPGHYTLVGSRNGYRDVRTEFTLQPGAAAQTIVIQCDEKI